MNIKDIKNVEFVFQTMTIPETVEHPDLSLLVKLGSLIVHLEEYQATNHPFDKSAIEQLKKDSALIEWFAAMNAAQFLPVKRTGADKEASINREREEARKQIKR